MLLSHLQIVWHDINNRIMQGIKFTSSDKQAVIRLLVMCVCVCVCVMFVCVCVCYTVEVVMRCS